MTNNNSGRNESMEQSKKHIQQYSLIVRSLFVIFGLMFAVEFINEMYFYLLNFDKTKIIPPLLTGPMAYVFLHTALIGRSPKWVNDQDVFNVKNKEDVDK